MQADELAAARSGDPVAGPRAQDATSSGFASCINFAVFVTECKRHARGYGGAVAWVPERRGDWARPWDSQQQVTNQACPFLTLASTAVDNRRVGACGAAQSLWDGLNPPAFE